jgi:hypothetical protein
MLVVPMKTQKDEVIGVLQLINAKRNPSVKLLSRQIVHREVVAFSERSQELAASLASQAAVSLENNLLYREIENLFEGFVRASCSLSSPATRPPSDTRSAWPSLPWAWRKPWTARTRGHTRKSTLPARIFAKSAMPRSCTTSARSEFVRKCWSKQRSFTHRNLT